MTRFVKRYANRKLYDIRASRYVSLDDLAEVVRGGEAIAVTDAATGDDLTSVTLAQIILERERACGGMLPAVLLHQLVRHGPEWQQAAADAAARDGHPEPEWRPSSVEALGELERLTQQLTALELRLQAVERHLQPPR